MQRRSSSDWSNLGSEYDAARKKANQSIINVKQFFPQLDGGIKMYKDKLSYLGHNSEDARTEPFSSKDSSVLDKVKEEEEEETMKKEEEETDKGVFATEVEASRSHDWLADRKRKLYTMQELVDGAVAEHYRAAMQATKSCEWDRALAKLRKCIFLRPQDPDFYCRRAEIYFELCDLKSAIANYRRCLRMRPDNREYWDRLAFFYLFHGQILFDQGFYSDALEAFAKASEMRPENVAYQTRSIACLTALGRRSECLSLVNRRLEAGVSADLLVMRARLHCSFRNFTLAFYDVGEALAMEPSHEAALQLQESLLKSAADFGRQAVELALCGRLRDALKKLNLAIDMNPSVASFHVRRAALSRRLGDFGTAVEDCLQALDKCDHDSETAVFTDAQKQLLLTFNDFAVECYLKGFYEESIGLLDKAIKAEKSEKALYINRGDCFYQIGNSSFALLDYEQATELDPADQSVRFRLSLVHHRIGQAAFQEKRFQESIRSFTEAISRNPLNSHLWIARARSLYFIADSSAARKDVAVALLLGHDVDESTRTLLSRLFPGEAPSGQLLDDSPELRRQAERQLQPLVEQLPSSVTAKLPQSALPSDQRKDGQLRRRRRQNPAVSIPSIAESMMERREHLELLLVVEDEVDGACVRSRLSCSFWYFFAASIIAEFVDGMTDDSINTLQIKMGMSA